MKLFEILFLSYSIVMISIKYIFYKGIYIIKNYQTDFPIEQRIHTYLECKY